MNEEERAKLLESIIASHEWLMQNWDDGLWGWAPGSVSRLLERNRLDRLLELARVLPSWTHPSFQSEGHLILAWATLGALVEGIMKWFLCVHEEHYSLDPVQKKGKPVDPDKLRFEELRNCYMSAGAWMDGEAEARDSFVKHIQCRRNAIHAYQDRDVGTFDEFWDHVRDYAALLDDLKGRTPDLPDEQA